MNVALLKHNSLQKQSILLKLNSFSFVRYEQSDGVSRSEEAVLKNVGTEQESIEVRGQVTWTAPDGQVFSLNFVSDENGYRPEGAHLPHL